MKKFTLLTLFCFFSLSVLAQVGIGTINPTTDLHIVGTTTVATSGTATLYSNDFESGSVTSVAGAGNACTTSPNIWHIAATSPEAGCTNCTNNRAYIEYSFSCAQNQTMVEGTFSPTTTSIDISFNYDFQDYLNESLFVVTLYNETTSSVTATLLNLNVDATDAVYTGNHTVVAGNSYSVRFQYEADNDWGAAVDDILVTEATTPTAGTYTFRLEDGTQSSGYVLTSDANGNGYWANSSGMPGGGDGGTDDGDWTVSGATMTNANTGQVIVINNVVNEAVLYVENSDTSATSTTTYGVHGVTSAVDAIGNAGIFGESLTTGDHEIGVKGDYTIWGAALAGIGWSTSVADMPTTGSGVGTETNDMGVYGGVDFGTGYGVYGYNANTITGFAGYFDGNHAITGTKSASVPTTKGNQLLYSMESPEIWFEDFGQSTLVNGKAHIQFDKMFQETVFIDDEHPMHVFLQEQGDCNGLYFVPDPDGNGFVVKEKQGGTSNITFSYRITAKRRFYQDHRFGLDFSQPLKNNLIDKTKQQPRTTDPNIMRNLIEKGSAEKQNYKQQIQKKQQQVEKPKKNARALDLEKKRNIEAQKK